MILFSIISPLEVEVLFQLGLFIFENNLLLGWKLFVETKEVHTVNAIYCCEFESLLEILVYFIDASGNIIDCLFH